MKILVTGGTGYIGSHTVVELLNANHDVVIVDNLFNSKKEVLDRIKKITGKAVKFYEADLRDAEKLRKIFAAEKPHTVIHFAGLKSVPESVEKPLEYYDNNIIGTLRLLEAMREFNTKDIVFSSTATVYGDIGVTEYDESLETGRHLTNTYSKTKYMIEEILRDAAAADSDMNVMILRYANPISAHESGLIGEDPNGIPLNLFPLVAQAAVGTRPDLIVNGDDYPTPDGTAIRDYIHVVDLAQAHMVALDNMDGFKFYNVGTGHGYSVLEIIAAFEKAIGHKIPYKIASRRAGDLPEYFLNADKAATELGWKAKKTLDDACRDAWNWQSNNPDGYDG
ncbi:UDP-glucose 4-epimerase [Alphaproteobacteria bacterium]|nr:UDP-glucose 4-epimerase [Alphaproteobacteria bacterium]